VPDQLEPAAVEQMGDVVTRPSKKIIEADDFFTLIDQSLAQV
jgi:hypothetical protein